MTIEEKLKAVIIERYGSMYKFAEITGIPNTTLSGIMKRGINNSNISNVFRICQALDISADELALGRITPNKELQERKETELADIFQKVKMQIAVYGEATVGGKPLTETDIQLVSDSLSVVLDIIRKRNEAKP